MTNRIIDTEILDYLKTRKPFSWAHLIKFERPIIAPQTLNTSDKEFVHLTDASIDLYFNDPRVDNSPENLATKYRANRVLQVPSITEYSEVRATSQNLQLDGNAIGAYLADNVIITAAGGAWEIEFESISAYDKGVVEGDKVSLELNSTSYELEVLKFPQKNVMRVSGDLEAYTGSAYLKLTSQELTSILQDKSSENYASFINREVVIYKVFFDEDNNRIGTPYYLYKGIVQDVSLDDTDGAIKIEWSMNSHWGDFAEVKGRITSDEYHRALNERAVPQPENAIKPVYAFDKGFIHADTAVHIESTYTVQVEKQDVKYKKGFFGIGAKVKVKKYFVDEPRQTELDFQLQGKTLDVIYGVRPVEGSAIFADTNKSDSSEVYVAYALCEGEIGGLYDIIIQDKSLICANESDFDVRSSQNTEETIDVICHGRADRGDVLEGVTSTTPSSLPFFDTDLLTYYNDQNSSFLRNYEGYNQPLGTSSGSVGIKHENSVRMQVPIDITLGVYTGRTNQRAAPDLVQLAKNKQFKIQSDYWEGNKLEYWGPNHRLLDTAYVTAKYKIAENETTIPDIKFVAKGKFINCYNYDWTYQPWDKATGEDAANFAIGDKVNIKAHSDDSLLNSDVEIKEIINVRDNEGILETRFLLSEEPDLGYVDGVPTITKFYLEKGASKWTMVTYNYEETSGSVAVTLEDDVESVSEGGFGNVVVNPGSDSNIYKSGGGFTSADGFPVETGFRMHKK